jgi:hypothetical protein
MENFKRNKLCYIEINYSSYVNEVQAKRYVRLEKQLVMLHSLLSTTRKLTNINGTPTRSFC